METVFAATSRPATLAFWAFLGLALVLGSPATAITFGATGAERNYTAGINYAAVLTNLGVSLGRAQVGPEYDLTDTVTGAICAPKATVFYGTMVWNMEPACAMTMGWGDVVTSPALPAGTTTTIMSISGGNVTVSNPVNFDVPSNSVGLAAAGFLQGKGYSLELNISVNENSPVQLNDTTTNTSCYVLSDIAAGATVWPLGTCAAGMAPGDAVTAVAGASTVILNPTTITSIDGSGNVMVGMGTNAPVKTLAENCAVAANWMYENGIGRALKTITDTGVNVVLLVSGNEQDADQACTAAQSLHFLAEVGMLAGTKGIDFTDSGSTAGGDTYATYYSLMGCTGFTAGATGCSPTAATDAFENLAFKDEGTLSDMPSTCAPAAGFLQSAANANLLAKVQKVLMFVSSFGSTGQTFVNGHWYKYPP